MNTRILEISIKVVHSPMDEAIGGESILRTKEEVLGKIQSVSEKALDESISVGETCSVVVGFKDMEMEGQ